MSDFSLSEYVMQRKLHWRDLMSAAPEDEIDKLAAVDANLEMKRRKEKKMTAPSSSTAHTRPLNAVQPSARSSNASSSLRGKPDTVPMRMLTSNPSSGPQQLSKVMEQHIDTHDTFQSRF